ncbi:Vacuolar protein-sorting-associated protein 37 -like protein 1 [Capsicum baccatum]|uniref:Vacuolar protein-sorting-associated protein 37-like protein 1 n=1 Tax=Capsicum baccatum TaxID=33114 RepID=A0A2G2VMM6_CAPBA|nr:Vacuolar protein-sorting-associated protein 37 -like protein 1 [Capsicum baccatum]
MVMTFSMGCDFFEEALRIVITLLVIVPLDELFFFYIIPIRKIDFEQNPYAGENLEKEPWIMELRNQCRIIHTTELVVAQEKMHDLKRRKEELLRLYSPVSLLHQLQGNLVGTLNIVPLAFLDVSPGGGGVLLGRTLKEVIFIPQHRSPKLAILGESEYPVDEVKFPLFSSRAPDKASLSPINDIEDFTRKKDILTLTNNIVKIGSKSASNKLRYDFVLGVTEANGSKVLEAESIHTLTD